MWVQNYSRIARPLSILSTIEGNLTFKKDAFDRADERIILHFCGTKMEAYGQQKDDNYFYATVLKKIKADPRFMVKVEKNIYRIMDNLVKLSGRISKLNLTNASNSKLIELLLKFNHCYAEIFGWGLINTYDRDLVKYIESYCLKKWDRQDGLRYFTILTSVTEDTYYEKEKKAILRASANFRSRSISKEAALQRLADDFGWLYINYEGEPRTSNDFKRIIEKILAEDPNPKQTLLKLGDRRKKLLAEQKKMEKALADVPGMLRLVRASRHNAFLREYRKPLAVRSMFRVKTLLAELAKRLGLTLEELKFLLPSEIGQALKNGGVDKRMIGERMKESVYDLRKNDYRVLVGDAAKKLLAEIKEAEIEKEIELRGMVACPGLAKGSARLVLEIKDGHNLQAGEVFVGKATSPELIQFLKKAVAIVTDEGGLTSHAAIISRELGIPCLVGTKNATKIFKTGDIVEVDAEKGIIKKRV